MSTDDYEPIEVGDALELPVVEIRHELVQRLTVQLSEPDLIAVETAVIKAAVAGFRVASGIIMDTVEAVSPVRFKVRDVFEDRDPWAERYGDGA